MLNLVALSKPFWFHSWLNPRLLFPRFWQMCVRYRRMPVPVPIMPRCGTSSPAPAPVDASSTVAARVTETDSLTAQGAWLPACRARVPRYNLPPLPRLPLRRWLPRAHYPPRRLPRLLVRVPLCMSSNIEWPLA